MARFTPARNLDQEVALRFARAVVTRTAERLRDEARKNAPAVHVWVTAHDERVRHTHVKADGQAIPGNLRFVLKTPNAGNDVNDIRTGTELARAPRDPALSIGNRINCRCASLSIADGIGHLIEVTDTTVAGTHVHATVRVSFPRIVESEHPSSPDSGGGWFAQAVHTVAQQPLT
jgi:hypothetical protein